MIDLTGIVSIPFLKKSHFTGSDKEKCFLIRMSKGEEDLLEAVIWPGPACYDKTSEELKIKKTFPLTEEGLLEAVTWMNKQD